MKTFPGSRASRSAARSEGIALLVVMVVFVILYLVVYQLHFSTSMEAKIAQVRYGEAESAAALHSVALYVMTLLVEDLKEDASASTGATGGDLGAGGGTEGERGGGRGRGAEGAGTEDAGGSFTPLVQSSGSARWTDYLHENLFKDNRQQVADISVKIRIIDGERAFDLNRLFDYPVLPGDAVDGSGIPNIGEEDLVGAVQGKSDEEAALSLRDKVMERSREKRASGRKDSAAGAGKAEEMGAADAAGAAAGTGAAGETEASEYELEEEFVMPQADRLQAAQMMVERAIEGMFSINENEYGYRYSVKYSASDLAANIIQYVLERRRQPYQNRIYLLTELLNIPGVTPEVFYGPVPFVAEGEELPVGTGFVLRRDDFGEVVPEYLYGEDPEILAQESLQLQELESQLGRFADLASFGFDPLKANPLTRGMSEQAIEMDQEGNEYVVEKPVAIGLKDIFTTWSSGKINLNTAPYPVIYALLLSLTTDEANLVALDIRDYRNRFQEEVEDEGVDRVSGTDQKSSPDLGQPKRKKKDETAAATESMASGAASASSLDPLGTMDPAALAELSAYQDVETNYFTSLDQIELVDGTEGDASDRLRKDEAIDRVNAEQDSLLRKVQNDLANVVFGSTYFNAELRAKPKNGGSVKVGHLTVRRDTKKRMVEVLMWKNFQR